MSSQSREIVLDISTLARSGGQAVGIVRVLREVARWALRNRQDAHFVIFDTEQNAFRLVQPQYVGAIIDGTAIVDLSTQRDDGDDSQQRPRRRPGVFRDIALWVRNPRRRIFMSLERIRLRHAPGGASRARSSPAWLSTLQSALLSPKYRSELTARQGARRALLPFEFVAGSSVTLGDQHILLCLGSDWGPRALSHIEQRKAVTTLRTVFLCYDIIPLMYPQFYLAKTAHAFRAMFYRMVPLVDLIVVTAEKIRADVAAYCRSNQLPVPNMRVVTLGSEFGLDARAPAALPKGLKPGRYALFVSTIEPRKGHRLLLSVWSRLLAAGLPQAAGFQLVLLGRRGWLVDELMADIEAHPSYGKSLMVLSGVSDDVLAEVYRRAAFCLFPSLYEGYGLSAVEAFSFGKAVIASSGGALPEVVGDLSPCLDPEDEDLWFETLRRWITDPSARAPFETAIRERFRPSTWAEVSQALFGAIDAELAAPPAKGADA